MELRASLQELSELTLGLEAGRYDFASVTLVQNLKARLQQAIPEAPAAVSAALTRTVEALDAVEAKMAEAGSAERRTMGATLAQRYEELMHALRTQSTWTAKGMARRITRDNPWRSLVHVAAGLGAALLYRYVLDRTTATIIIGLVATTGLSLEGARRHWAWFNTWIMNTPLVRRIARSDEHHRLNSSTWFVTGLALSVVCFPPLAVQIGCVVLAVGDPAAGFIGRRMGGPKLLEAKSLGGSLAFVIISALTAGAFIVTTTALSGPIVLILALTAAFVGSIAELFSRSVDDNFTVPLVTAAAVTLILHVWVM